MYLASQAAFSQTKFEQGMQKAFTLMSENKNDEAVNMLERIANAEPENWIPPYHIALLKARTSFAMTNKSAQEAQIKSAEDFIDRADAISPDNSEIYVIKAMVNVAKIASNPMVNGASLSAPTEALYRKAVALDATNPRAYSGLAEFEMGAARFFGKDLTPYCTKLQESIKLYDAFQPASKMAPNWGKEWTLSVIASTCGTTKSTTTATETAASTEKVTIQATVENVSGTEGKVHFALYTKETFMKEPVASKVGTIVDGKATVTFEDIKNGAYAIVCFHDKNENNTMDFQANGMPLEDYGSSNNKFRMGPPLFEDAKFTVENKSLNLGIRF
tara:strand:- start:58243 stop:59235 length:993 start_codon:yes stop_codon:yes gene_type:complete